MTAEPTSWFHIWWVTFAPGTVPSSRQMPDEYKVNSIMSHPIESESEAHTLRRWSLKTLSPSWGHGMEKDHALHSLVCVIEHAKELSNSNSSMHPLWACLGGCYPLLARVHPSQSPHDDAVNGIYIENLQGFYLRSYFGELLGIFKSEYFDSYPQIQKFDLI